MGYDRLESSQEAFHCFALQAHKSTRRRHWYFGERIGMYFYFLSDHNRGLLRPAIVGVVTHIIALFWVEARNVIVPIWAV